MFYYLFVEYRKNLKIVKGIVRSIMWKKVGKKDLCKLVIVNGVEYLDKDGKVN